MSTPLKIGITCYPTLGGSGVVATELGKLLAELGHEVHFITHSVPFRLGKFHQNIYYHEVEVTDYHVFRYPPYDLSLASKMAQVAKMKKLDVLHVHYALPHAICAYLAKKMVGDDLKVVTTLHGTDITILGQEAGLHDLIRLGIEESDAVTAVSNDLIQETMRVLNTTKPIELVYNFVDKREYFPKPDAELRLKYAQPDEKIAIHISNFRPVKRVQDVAAIFEKVAQQVNAKLLFVGEGPDLPRVRNWVEERGFSDRVMFLGKQEEVARIISLADVMLLPSEKESFGLVALEAMACGVPTVASHTGGIPELITHDETGYLAPVGDVDQMAAYATKLLSDAQLHAEFVTNGLVRAREYFCNNIITSQYEEIYYRVLGRPAPERD
jgi:N-acetyl-alpha-D-glucosaminyl L-malate synthase BshA